MRFSSLLDGVKSYPIVLQSTRGRSQNQVFRIDDILDLVCGFATHSTLLSLIRVNQSAFFTARRHVWSTIPTAFHVLRLLPFFINRGGLWTISLTTYPAAWEWSRFDLYASAVQRIISLSSSTAVGSKDINPRVYMDLAMVGGSKFRTTSIFPNLRAFVLNGSGLFGNIGPSRIDYLCSATLTQVEIRAHQEYLETYLRNLSVAAENLADLTVIGQFNSRALELLPTFPHLHSLTIGTLYETDADRILLSPRIASMLQKLCKVTPVSRLVIQSHIITPLRYPALSSVQHLELEASSSTILNVFGAGRFRSVIVTFDEAELTSTYNACFAALSRTSSQTIESVVIHSSSAAMNDFPVIPCVEPLLDAPNIRELCIHHSERLNVALDDGDVLRLVTAWADLAKLVLPSSSWTSAGHDRNQQPTFLSINLLLRMPQMTEFSVRAENHLVTCCLPVRVSQVDGFSRFPVVLRRMIEWHMERRRK